MQLAARIARKYEIPERFFENLVRTESAFQPRALSPKGAMGLGQLMPATARELGLRVEAGEAEGSVWHPPSNLDASARYLRWLYGQFGGEGKSGEEVWPLAAGAYNAGIGNIRRALAKVRDAEPPVWNSVARVLPEVTGRAAAETLRYVERVMG
ncbi:MAG: lytic transglycosylase domain-containing protein [Nitrospinaceae bacterium]